MTRCNNRKDGCNNVISIGNYCDEHQPVIQILERKKPDENTVKPDKDVLPMTPQQKAAKTRAENKEKKEMLQKELAKLE